MSASSIWSRVKTRWSLWQRYEYPEAHRQPPPPRSPNNNGAASSSSSSIQDELLLPHSIRDHPLHQTTLDRLQCQLDQAARFCFWTIAHGAAMYVFWVYVKPRLVDYFHSHELDCGDDSDDEEEEQDNDKPKWKKHWKKRFSFSKKRLCCCCDAMVSQKDNYCPKCGSPTCPVCVYCGAGIQNDDHYCNSCGRPVPNQVIVDGGPPQVPGSFMRRGSSSMSASNNNGGSQQRILQQQFQQSPQAHYQNVRQGSPTPAMGGSTNMSQEAIMQPYVGGTLNTQQQELQQPKTDTVAEATAESVPIVQADGFAVPLVPAMYVEEVTPLEAPTTQETPLEAPTTTQGISQMIGHSHAIHEHEHQQEQQETGEQTAQQEQLVETTEEQQEEDAPTHAESELIDNNIEGGNKRASKQQ